MNDGPESMGGLVDYGIAARTANGETVSGDRYLLKPLHDGVLVAVVDGIGHGEEALKAALAALRALERATDSPLIALMERTHKVLAGTRGAVMTLARLRTPENSLTWVGVGNVEAHLIRGGVDVDRVNESLITRNGLLGLRLPAMRTSVLPLSREDLLILATDGIRSGFTEEINRTDSPQDIAARILDQYFKGNDDALVVVIRYHGTFDG